ncbi:hypothetical protein RCL1_005276 [Eukaryota sp. TZLM3-RCL]
MVDVDAIRIMFPNLSLAQITQIVKDRADINDITDECLRVSSAITAATCSNTRKSPFPTRGPASISRQRLAELAAPKKPVPVPDHFSTEPKPKISNKPRTSSPSRHSIVPSSSLKTPSSSITNTSLKQLHEQRVTNRGAVPSKPQKSLQDIRKLAADRYKQAPKPKPKTCDIQTLEKSALEAPPVFSQPQDGVHTVENTIFDPVRMGVRCLELSNEYRKSRKLPPMTWHQVMHDAGMPHSKDMAEGKVPFSHEGFNERCKKFPFSWSSVAENVAFNYNCSDPCKTAVDGWIESPGHRANLEGNFNLCSISVYESNGNFYFTQLFAKSRS